MCRIAGIINFTESKNFLLDQVKAMCNVMAHGGPDDQGIYYGDEHHLSFGHRRLSIIDLSSAGHQPMFFQENNLVITYNGEIYNHIELRSELISLGYSFRTNCDTEVILAGYAAWGTECFNRLNGMFAFGLHDVANGLTFLARDKSGIKPLYYSSVNKSLVFASEVKAFQQIKYCYKENPNWKIYFLAFGHIPEPYTTLSDVFSLPKGKYLKWNHSDSSYTIHNYQIKLQKPNIIDQSAAEKQVYKVLKNSVKQQLIADAPIGVYLSGGIDSSIITLLASNIKSEKDSKSTLNTVSINFDETAFSEKVYQDLISSKTNGNHSELLIDQDLFSQLFPSALNGMDQPSTDGINAWFINYFAKKQGLKAVLSGIGADELFGGYPSFKRMRMVSLLSRIPKFLLKQSVHFINPILARSYYLRYQNLVGEYLFLRGIFSPNDISQLLNISINEVDQVLSSLPIKLPSALKDGEKARWIESNLYMQNQLLKDTDMMSMQHGVEVRVPFLDETLLNLVEHIDKKIIYGHKRQKKLLIDAFKEVLPQAVWDRTKMGFSFPFQKWLSQDGFLSVLHTDNAKAKQVMHAFKKGKVHWSKALAIHIIQNTLNTDNSLLN